MTLDLTIRAAMPADIVRLVELAREIWQQHYPPIIGQPQVDFMLARDYHPQLIGREFASGVYRWDLAMQRETAVGFASYGPMDATDGVLWLRKLYVVLAVRGTGCGYALFERAVSAGRRGGFRDLSLRVNKDNASAIRAYRRMGFAITASICSDIGGGFVMDDYVMTLAPERGVAADSRGDSQQP